MAKSFLFFYNHIFPIFGFPWVFWLWYRVGGMSLATLITGLPLVFGYIMPGIGTNILKKWRFNGPFRMGNFFIHQGFIYSSTMGLGLYLAMFPAASGPWQIPMIIFRTAAIVGFVAWWVDILGVKTGLIEIYNGPWKRGAAPEVIVTHYAPICFSLLGASYGAVGAMAYQMILSGDTRLAWLWPTGFIAMMAATCVPYLWLEKK